MTDHFLTPITVPAWVLDDLLMASNVSHARSKVEDAIDAAAQALDEGGFDVAISPSKVRVKQGGDAR